MGDPVSKLPPLNALKCFEAAARSGSFSRAADELHVTQSAVSHQIRQLEEWFGVPLFDRQGRRTVPTQDGADLAHALADAFAIMAAACKRLAQRDTGQALTIGVLPSIATIWLIPRLTDFLRDNPDISPRVQYAFHGQRLDFDDIDIAIQWGIPPQGLGRITKLLNGSTIAVCSEAFLSRHSPIERPRDISERPLLHDTDRTGWQNWLKASGVKAPGPLPGPVFEDFNLLRAAALSGQGVALCPASLIAGDLADRRLVRLFDTTIHEDHAYYLVEPESPASHRHAAAISKFKAWLLKEAQASSAG
jgi:DNA-binding transcriptional LysR family regulator